MKNVGDLVRMIARLFAKENKLHLALLMEKMFKMFVSYFD